MASRGLTECWREAMAARPSDWRLMGGACGPREVDPNIHRADEWCVDGALEIGCRGLPSAGQD